MDAQLKRGLLNICILQLLKQGDRYGYDMIKILLQYFPGTDESTFYAILRRMHKECLADMYYSDASNGPRRKYYKITENGKQVLAEYVDSIYEIKKILSELGIMKGSIDNSTT